MNMGKLLSFIFISVGSIILITLGVIMTMNFMKDARVFQQTVATAVQDPEVKNEDKKENKKITVKTEDKKAPANTNKKQESESTKTESKAKTEEPAKTDTAAASDANKEKIKVEVVNYSGIKRVAEQIKTTLEASGYEVSAGNDKSNKPVSTAVIERNDKKAGADIKKLLNIGPVRKSPDAASRFDVTIIIGDDYKP